MIIPNAPHPGISHSAHDQPHFDNVRIGLFLDVPPELDDFLESFNAVFFQGFLLSATNLKRGVIPSMPGIQ